VTSSTARLTSYSITLSARTNSAGGTVTPIALAVLRLITSSNLSQRAGLGGVDSEGSMSAARTHRPSGVASSSGHRPILYLLPTEADCRGFIVDDVGPRLADLEWSARLTEHRR
jgi:hypothetical protein